MKLGDPVVVSLLLLATIIAPVTASVYFSSSVPEIITKGDTFTVNGTHATNGTIGIWIIGNDHYEVLTTAPDRQGNFSLVLKPSATAKFFIGQYVIVYQDPGQDGVMEIEPGTDSNGNLTIMNRGKIIARFGAMQDLRGEIPAVLSQLLAAASIPGVDDSFLAKHFFVEEPAVNFNQLIPASGLRLPDQITGERIFFSGTTNVGTENSLRADLRNGETDTLVLSKTIPVVGGSETNTWSYELGNPGLQPGDYYLTIGWTKSNTTGTGSATFTVRQPLSPQPPPSIPVRENLPLQDDPRTFIVLVTSSLLVIAIILYALGKR